METSTIQDNKRNRFHIPPPIWFKELEEEANRRITSAPFAEFCRKGEKEAMKRLMVNLWPFVEIFPKLVRNGYMRLLNPGMYMQYGVINMLSLTYHSMVFLSGIEHDEKTHRNLWTGSGTALGLIYPNSYEQPITPQTQAWIDEVASKINPTDMFLAFVAIEFIAESVSRNFLGSHNFKNTFGNSQTGLGWFTVHIVNHGDKSHANLELQLSLAFRQKSDESTQQTAERVILGVVDKFLAAANACV